MYDIYVNVEDLKRIKEGFGSKVVQETLDISIKKSIVILNRNAIMETPVDRGRLRSSYQTEFRAGYGRLFNPVNYAIFVHEGTRPHNAPFDPIAGRAKRKGANAGGIRRSIKMRGTKANPFMTRAIDKTDKEIDKIFQAEIDKLILNFNRR